MRECIDQIDKDPLELKARLVQSTKKVKEILKKSKTSASGSGMNHKCVLGAYWSIGPQLQKHCLVLRKNNVESSAKQTKQ